MANHVISSIYRSAGLETFYETKSVYGSAIIPIYIVLTIEAYNDIDIFVSVYSINRYKTNWGIEVTR